MAVDLSDRPAWDRAVLGEVAVIPWGETASYGDIARRIGAPRAARAVGGALGRNPIGLLIPCHRVIAADGTIGGYGGDAWGSVEDRLAIKRDLLLREGVTVGRARRLDSAHDRPRGQPSGGSMTVAVAPAPSMFAVFRRRDFTLLWLAQLVSTAGSSLTSWPPGSTSGARPSPRWRSV